MKFKCEYVYLIIMLVFCTELVFYKITLIYCPAKDNLVMQNSVKMNWKIYVLCLSNTSLCCFSSSTLKTCLTSVSRLQLKAELKNRV